ncbi:MAG: DUF4385 domain-containing protein [Patescibacteria group bacterium]
MTEKKRVYKSRSFDYSLDYANLDLRKNPELYRIGRGEQGVLVVEPYKSEILPYWKFKTPDVALKSAKKIFALFNGYKKEKDFVGMDMARKFLQMGYTRSRRYANHASGQKFEKNPQKEASPDKEKKARTKVLPQEKDWGTSEKAESARIFYGYYMKAKEDPSYLALKKIHQETKKGAD